MFNLSVFWYKLIESYFILLTIAIEFMAMVKVQNFDLHEVILVMIISYI